LSRRIKTRNLPSGWLPITQQDFSINEVPNDPGADAIQLYMSYYKDDDSRFISVYKRIRILRESGRERADVEIRIQPGQSLKELAARTIHPDQKIIDFAGKPFEKVIIKGRGIKFVAQVFTLPDVTVGSIIEYRYIIALPPHIVSPISVWPVQGDLYPQGKSPLPRFSGACDGTFGMGQHYAQVAGFLFLFEPGRS
jgi:hypothetical protein